MARPPDEPARMVPLDGDTRVAGLGSLHATLDSWDELVRGGRRRRRSPNPETRGMGRPALLLRLREAREESWAPEA